MHLFDILPRERKSDKLDTVHKRKKRKRVNLKKSQDQYYAFIFIEICHTMMRQYEEVIRK